MIIEIICTGDEILSGKTINTNYAYMAQKLADNGFQVRYGTTVGDDRECLYNAFIEAGKRADAVIVNGGLGPTVDDLSQEIAASAAGVELQLNQHWLERMAGWYRSRGRDMPENNKKQAMLPVGAEFIDNPVGTACGFAVTIGQARFLFTPGVPRELRRMLGEQIIPRLQKIRGVDSRVLMKRFHTFGIGESRADRLLDGVERLAADGSVKLGFQSHYPQLETKLMIQGSDSESMQSRLAPVADAVRRQLAGFILAEDDETLEQRIMTKLCAGDYSLAIMEWQTAGAASSRMLSADTQRSRIRYSTLSQDLAGLLNTVAVQDAQAGDAELATQAATALRDKSAASHALVILMRLDEAENEHGEMRAAITVAVSDSNGTQIREAVLPGGRSWIRLGAAELALDCLRRHLEGLPLYQRIDFEQH